MAVQGVWVIDSNGVPLFHKAYTPLEFDAALFSGFFSAVVHFQTEFVGHQLQEIFYEGLCFRYTKDANLVFLTCVSKEGDYSNLPCALRDLFAKYFRGKLELLSAPLRDNPEAKAILQKFEQDLDDLVR